MSEQAKKRTIRLSLFTFAVVLLIFFVYLIYRFYGIGFKCPFFEITGFKCAGCGNTHALESVINLDLGKSFSFNYAYPLEIFYIGWVYAFSAKEYLLNGKFSYKPPYQAFDIAVLVIIIAWIPIRNMLGL